MWVKADRYLDGFEQEPSTDLQHVKNVGKYICKVVKTRQDIKKIVNYYSEFYNQIIDEQEERYIKFAMKR